MKNMIFLLFFFGLPALSMKQNEANEISIDLLLMVFQNLDTEQLSKTLLVCKKWRDIGNNEKLWNYLCERRFGNHMQNLRSSLFDAKNYYFKMEKLSVLALNLKSFSKEKILDLLNDEELENDFLSYLELRLSPFSIKENVDAKSIVSFLIAHHIANISTSRNAVLNTLRKIAWIKDENSIEKKMDIPILKAFEVSAAASIYSAWYIAFAAAYRITEQGISKKCWEIANKALEIGSILVVEDVTVKHKASMTIALLLSLLENSGQEFQKQYFLKAYEAAHKSLVDEHFALSNNEVISIIADITWKKSDDVAQISYIISLKRMLNADYQKTIKMSINKF